MKNLKKYINWIIISLIVILLIWMSMFILKQNKSIAQANVNIIQLEYDINNKSDIEILENLASKANTSNINYLNKINNYKKTIKKLEIKFETSILKERCFKAQINRKIEWLEYNYNHCKEIKNLNQFRLKK